MTEISPAEIRMTLQNVALIASMLRQYDLSAILEGFQKCDTIGVMLEPTQWMETRDTRKENEEMIRAALPLWQWANKKV